MVDHDGILDQFDCLWRDAMNAPELGVFLEQSSIPREHRLSILLELIAIDMEYRWRRAGRSFADEDTIDVATASAENTGPHLIDQHPLVEDYAKIWPEIVQDAPVPTGLIAEEFRIRHRWGDRPAVELYAQRFGENSGLAAALEAVRLELKLDEDEVETHSWGLDTGIETRRSGSGPGASSLPETTQLSRYRILKRLGKGGMGEVFLAADTHLDRRVALKIPHAVDSERLRARFVNEAKAAAILQHPGICPVFDTGEISGQPFLTMAYIEGPTLSEFLENERGVSVLEIATLFASVARAMQAAHDAGIVHRDLKPSNIMLDGSGNPIVMDFGLAARERIPEDERITRTDDTFGSPAYMSPEQVEGRASDVGPSSDIYSLGVMLFEALTERLPFTGTASSIMVKSARDAPPAPSDLGIDVQPDLEQLCLQMLSKESADRPVSMTEVADRLAAISDCLSDNVQPESDCQQTRRVWRWSTVACVSAVVVLSAAAAIHFRSPDGNTSRKLSADNAPASESAQLIASPPIGFALSFDGVDDHVVTPIVYDGSHPITIEAWVAPANPYGNGAIVANATDTGIYLHQSYNERAAARNWLVRIGSNGRWIAEAAATGEFPHRRTHVAVVWDQSTLQLYLDGQLQSNGAETLGTMPAIKRPFLIGTRYTKDADSGFSNFWFHGEIDEVRISDTARYCDNFSPQHRFEPDEHTLGLYHFDETEGSAAVDASGHGNHADIIGASRVAAATMDRPGSYARQTERFIEQLQKPQPARTGPALRFDQPEAHVTVPPIDFDFTQPFAMEVWLTPDPAFESVDWKRVAAQVGPLSLSILNYHETYAFQVWFERRGVNANSQWPGAILSNHRTHLVGQWNGHELELFVNGCRSPGPLSFRNLPSTSASEFLMQALQSASEGQLTLGRRGVGKSVVGGLIDRFRLSRGVRYLEDFEPTDFVADEQTVVLYDFHEGAGDVLHDLSGNGYDAAVVGAAWVTADGATAP
ncbi:MAG: protein kinase domain-containing protein [Planctomycetota bacterium]|jgi:serine/threonine protein kinase